MSEHNGNQVDVHPHGHEHTTHEHEHTVHEHSHGGITHTHPHAHEAGLEEEHAHGSDVHV